MIQPERAVRGGVVLAVEDASPAQRCGIEPGFLIVSANGQPLRDVIDWMWLSDGEECEIAFLDDEGMFHEKMLHRGLGSSWGISFTEAIFDKVRTCRNACTFCFMRQLPSGVRSSLVLRDDDYRLSFLNGNFVTLTNLDEADIERIIEQHISPLRVSLHASDPDVRASLIGKHAQKGIDNLVALLDAGIEVDAQIVLVPGVNDAEVLTHTLEWVYAHEGISSIGIVPLGYTKYQDAFTESFDAPERAQRVLDLIKPFQSKAEEERGAPWVFAADEFYRNAYEDELLEHLPSADFYGDFSLFEDGIGIIRSAVDDFEYAAEGGLVDRAREALQANGVRYFFICGEAMLPYFPQLLERYELDSCIFPLVVKNDYFGGNVNVTGLLCGCDIVRVIKERMLEVGDADANALFAIPSVIFNDDGLTLDDMSLDDIHREAGAGVRIVPSNPLDWFEEMIEEVKG